MSVSDKYDDSFIADKKVGQTSLEILHTNNESYNQLFMTITRRVNQTKKCTSRSDQIHNNMIKNCTLAKTNYFSCSTSYDL